MAIILASSSPRRRELLKQIGCAFQVVSSDVEEDNGRKLMPAALAIDHAKAKAMSVARHQAGENVVIGADTVVVCGDTVFGKPVDDRDARHMLTSLSGRNHDVMTGLAVVRGGEVWTDCAVTTVTFACLTADEIDRYLASGEPFGKAGAYAIQGRGALLVERINGCYSNVVGLPLFLLAQLMRKAGVPLL